MLYQSRVNIQGEAGKGERIKKCKSILSLNQSNSALFNLAKCVNLMISIFERLNKLPAKIASAHLYAIYAKTRQNQSRNTEITGTYYFDILQ
jgi:hypothetical protein